MKIPVNPPKEPANALILPYSPYVGIIKPSTESGEYLHWDKIRHLTPPYQDLTHEQWWYAIKIARRLLYHPLSFVDKFGKPFVIANTDFLLQQFHAIDQVAGKSVFSKDFSAESEFLIQSLFEEAIRSSQLEGAMTSRKVAKEMLETQRKPMNESEKMIVNNLKAMQYIIAHKDDELTETFILELHQVITQGTLADSDHAGKLRESDDIKIWDNEDNILHEPPKAQELKERLAILCSFANKPNEQCDFYLHPIAKAIILHFMIAYDHPFVDGNGRTARAIFYWSMLKQGYELAGFISVSEIIKQAKIKYAKAYLYTETDENDLTYFIMHQTDVIIKAIQKLEQHIASKNESILETQALIKKNKTLSNQLNHRQIALIENALKQSRESYTITTHRQAHQVTYDTARTDLLKLAKLGLLEKQLIGKTFVFFVPRNLKEIIEKME